MVGNAQGSLCGKQKGERPAILFEEEGVEDFCKGDAEYSF